MDGQDGRISQHLLCCLKRPLIHFQVKAGTKGTPGTPRDGAPVEITGLLKSTLRWLTELSDKELFPFKGVEATGKQSVEYRTAVTFSTVDGTTRFVTYKEWNDLLQASFEQNYYIPLGRPF